MKGQKHEDYQLQHTFAFGLGSGSGPTKTLYRYWCCSLAGRGEETVEVLDHLLGRAARVGLRGLVRPGQTRAHDRRQTRGAHDRHEGVTPTGGAALGRECSSACPRRVLLEQFCQNSRERLSRSRSSAEGLSLVGFGTGHTPLQALTPSPHPSPGAPLPALHRLRLPPRAA